MQQDLDVATYAATSKTHVALDSELLAVADVPEQPSVTTVTDNGFRPVLLFVVTDLLFRDALSSPQGLPEACKPHSATSDGSCGISGLGFVCEGDSSVVVSA